MKKFRISHFLLAILMVVTLFGCSGNKGSAEDAGMNWQEQYDLGIRYLSEGNYEEAIIAFTAAIEIDPKQADAYIGLAETYIAQDNPEKAAEVLEQALEAIGENDTLLAALGHLQEVETDKTPANFDGVVRTERIDHENGYYAIEEYAADGELLRSSMYTADGTLSYVDDLYGIFNEHGGHALIRRTSYNEDGTVFWVDERLPNGKNQRSFYHEDGRVEVTERDDRLRVYARRFEEKDGYRIVEYDVTGNEVGERRFVYEYDNLRSVEYDENGNIKTIFPW